MVTAHKPPTERELAAYFALTEVSSLLAHAVERQLRSDGDLSLVQFQILALLAGAPGGRARMTDLADGIVYSRSGLTYQAARLADAGLVSREKSAQDERSITVTVAEAGRDRVDHVMPGHVAAIRDLLFQPLEAKDVSELTRILGLVRDRMRAAPPRSATRSRRATPSPSDDAARLSGPLEGRGARGRGEKPRPVP